MKGFKIIIDFINFAFLLGLIVFILLYIIIGDRLDAFTNIAKALVPVAYFFGMLLLGFRMDRDKIEKIRKEDKLDEIIRYLDKTDSIKDIVVIITLPVTVLLLAMINEVNTYDIIQAITAFVLMYLWHMVIFRRKEDMAGIQFMTNFDKIKDQIVIFLLPLVIVTIPFGIGLIDTIDFLQTFAVFILMYGWRKIMLFNAK